MYEARSQILGGDIVTFDVDRSCSPGFVMVSTERFSFVLTPRISFFLFLPPHSFLSSFIRQGRIAVLTLSEKEEFFSPFICLSSTVQTVHLFNTVCSLFVLFWFFLTDITETTQRGKCLIKRARRGD